MYTTIILDKQINSIFLLLSAITCKRLECGTWYHHPRRQQCVLSRSLRIFKVATWHYRCRHHLKNNCIWDNFGMLLIILQLNLYFQLNNHSIRPPNAASGDLKTESATKAWLLQQHSYFLHFSFCSILIILRLTELRPFKIPRSPNKPVTFTFDLQSRKVLLIEIFFWHV